MCRCWKESTARINPRNPDKETPQRYLLSQHGDAGTEPHIRVIRPLAADRTEIFIYPVKLKGAEKMFRDQLAPEPDAFPDVARSNRRCRGLRPSPGRHDDIGQRMALLARTGPQESLELAVSARPGPARRACATTIAHG